MKFDQKVKFNLHSDDAIGEVAGAVERIDHLAAHGVDRDRVEGEIPPRQVAGRERRSTNRKAEARQPAVDDGPVPMPPDEAEGPPAAAPQLPMPQNAPQSPIPISARVPRKAR